MNTTLRLTACMAVASLIAWMALVPDQPTILWIDKLDHVEAFGALALVLRFAGASTRTVAWTCLASAVAIEAAQGWFVSLRREMSATDLLASCTGAALALIVLWAAERFLRSRSAGPDQRPVEREALSSASR